MELPRRDELLRILLGDLTQWLGEYGPYVKTLRAFTFALDCWVERPDRRASLHTILRSTWEELQRRDLAIKSDIERFLPYFDEKDCDIYRMFQLMAPHEFGEGLDGKRLRADAWITAVEQLVARAGQLRNEVMAQLDSKKDDGSGGRTDPIGIDHGRDPIERTTGGEEHPHDQTQPPQVEQAEVGPSHPGHGDSGHEARPKPGYLGLVFYEERKVVRREGVPGVELKLKSKLQWGLLKFLAKREERYSGYGELGQVWMDCGRAQPDEGAIRVGLGELRKNMGNLGLKIDNATGIGWILVDSASDKD